MTGPAQEMQAQLQAELKRAHGDARQAIADLKQRGEKAEAELEAAEEKDDQEAADAARAEIDRCHRAYMDLTDALGGDEEPPEENEPPEDPDEPQAQEPA